MLLVFAPEPSFRKVLYGALAPENMAVATWRELEQRAGTASCVVAHLEPAWSDAFERLRYLKLRLPQLPIVLVTARSPDVAIAIRDVIIVELVWTDQVPALLRAAVARATSRAYFQQLAAGVRQYEAFTPMLKEFLATVLLARTGFSTVEDAARALRVHARTVRNHWKISLNGRSSLSPKEFLDWLILLKAAALSSTAVPWKAVAAELGIHQRTLDRIACRLLRTRSRRAIQRAAGAIRLRFAREVVPCLFAAGVPEMLTNFPNCHYVELVQPDNLAANRTIFLPA